MRELAQTITRNYLTLCYDCTDAHMCDTESECLACWADREAADDGEREETTARYLQLYAQ